MGVVMFIVGTLLGECHATCQIKTSVVDFIKKRRCIEASTEDYIVRPYSTLHISSVIVKSRFPGGLISFLNSIELLCIIIESEFRL
jgi:hypothetical protein